MKRRGQSKRNENDKGRARVRVKLLFGAKLDSKD